MNVETLIAPTDIRDYAKGQGWVLVKEAAKDRLYVMTNPRFERRQLVFPMDTTAPDYSEAVMLIVDKLAAIEGRSQQAVFKSLVAVGDEARVTTPRPVPITSSHARSRVGITRAKSALTLIEAARLIVANDDISALETDELNMPMTVTFMASCWGVSPEYARRLVLDVKALEMSAPEEITPRQPNSTK